MINYLWLFILGGIAVTALLFFLLMLSRDAFLIRKVKRKKGPLLVNFSLLVITLSSLGLAGIDQNSLDVHPLNLPLIDEVREKLNPNQQYIRGLFTGGTLCDEAMFTAKERFSDVYSNIATDQEHLLHFGDASKAHTFIDFGADEFTNGKPHPMIDPSNRIARFTEEAADPTVGVILMDFVLGYGAHPDPVGVMVPAMKAAKERAAAEGRHLEIIGYVLGTDLDKQNINEQVEKLTSIGATYASSSQNAGLLAREFVVKD
ncbi:hypothetical protein IGL98_003053 [Enterococcus sp. DIV0840]